MKLPDFDFWLGVFAAFYFMAIVEGVRRVVRALRARKDGPLTPEMRAELVFGVAEIVFVPVAIGAMKWLGYVGGFAVLLIGLAIGVWYSETVEPNVH